MSSTERQQKSRELEHVTKKETLRELGWFSLKKVTR